MKEKLKLKFVDFWVDLNQPGTLFYEILSQKYEVEFSDNPDLLFYSNNGTQYMKYRCIRVFVSGENERPDYTACDYAISFDYSNSPKHLRFPLWTFYYWTYLRIGTVANLDAKVTGDELLRRWKSKNKFCCFVVSNGKCKKRNQFFERLNTRKRVDSAGRYKNNIGRSLEEGTLGKLKFIKDYKFVISFENASHPGYVTEKVLEPLLAGCIPIYWGDPLIDNDFNTRRLINYSSFKKEEDVIDYILKVDSNDELAASILQEKVFTNQQPGLDAHISKLNDFIVRIADQRNDLTPVSRIQFYSIQHKIKVTSIGFAVRLNAFIKRVASKVLKPFLNKQLLTE